MEKMYVVQADIYFYDDVSEEEQDYLLEPFEDILGVSFKRDSPNAVRIFKFYDNCNGFEATQFKKKVGLLKDTDRVRIAGFYMWDMDVDEPTWKVEIRN